MEDKIEIGEYVRLKDGRIRIFKNYVTEEDIELTRPYNTAKIEDIVKHSKNIIDLIEVGDYVNGYKITDIISDYLYTEVLTLNGDYKTICDYQINSILTKEQFESIEYKV